MMKQSKAAPNAKISNTGFVATSNISSSEVKRLMKPVAAWTPAMIPPGTTMITTTARSTKKISRSIPKIIFI